MMKLPFFGKPKGRYHVNPDGSVGGYIPAGAEVHPSATIEPTAIIVSGARVAAGKVIRNGDVVTLEGSIVRFAPSREKAPSPQ